MTKVAEFIDHLDNQEQAMQLMAESLLCASKFTMVEMMDHASYDQRIGQDAHALLGSTFHHEFDYFLENNRISREDGQTWYEWMINGDIEIEEDDVDPGIEAQDKDNAYKARMPL